ncbi:hypothetical protein [Aquimarina sp. 2201CG5-10]|uniref:hypothetical protein n=1 Tax=Aquimarina callyspongiae TaxID=3098150 RepID=UPI002AB5CF2A|nr:hypothetical protein [Aquimarina sp. 2201CG5-10]MDY8136131.1 hypothetical protein [Aquimarina sp. 2201CG5-10]
MLTIEEFIIKSEIKTAISIQVYQKLKTLLDKRFMDKIEVDIVIEDFKGNILIITDIETSIAQANYFKNIYHTLKEAKYLIKKSKKECDLYLRKIRENYNYWTYMLNQLKIIKQDEIYRNSRV